MIHPKNNSFSSIFDFVAIISYSTPKKTSFFASTYFKPIWDWSIYHSQPSGAPSEPQNGHTYTQKNNCFPSISILVANIRYSTPKMTPLTISLLQPISNLSGIGVSTIPDHWGPHQSPKMATHTPKKQLFP